MPPIPLIGRLHIHEYVALIGSFILLFLETIVRTITLLLPTPIIHFCYRMSRNAFNSLSSPYSRRARNKKKSVSSPIAQASDFVELCELYGYAAEEHIVQTKDGYLLGLHRLGWRQGEEDQRVNSGPGSVQKKVVYLHHGLLMNSEVWVCLTEKERCLPFMLVDQGYDVWLGNNRGNKYSKKSLHHAPTEVPFWNFSMDQFAFHDIPDSINYILSTTNQPSLSYIGFSQGTAQAFATLSIHPTLNSKVDVFVALAPAMAPPGLASGIVSSLVKSNPEVLFLAFGRRAMLGSTTMWQALLYPAIFSWFIDKSLAFLFGWRTQNITPHQKLAAYPHLYSFTSVKSVVHWFQIIRNGTFQMYDDEVTTPLAMGNGSKYYKVAKFPTRNIKTPIVLVYGGSDSLVDINLMLKELPRHTVAKGIAKYEHLDLLWASDVDKLVFPHVLEALESNALPEQTKQAALGWHSGSHGLLDQSSLTSGPSNDSLPPGYSEDERAVVDGTREILARQPTFTFSSRNLLERPSTAEEQLDESDFEDDSTPEHLSLTPSRPISSSPALRPGPAPSFGAVGSVRAPISPPTSPRSHEANFSPKRRILPPVRLRSRQKIPQHLERVDDVTGSPNPVEPSENVDGSEVTRASTSHDLGSGELLPSTPRSTAESVQMGPRDSARQSLPRAHPNDAVGGTASAPIHGPSPSPSSHGFSSPPAVSPRKRRELDDTASDTSHTSREDVSSITGHGIRMVEAKAEAVTGKIDGMESPASGRMARSSPLAGPHGEGKRKRARNG